MTPERKFLVLGFSVFVWVVTGLWLGVYEKLDSWHPARGAAGFGPPVRRWRGRRGPAPVCSAASTGISRPFVVLFAAYAWILLALFRLSGGRMAAAIRREFAAPHYVMVVGTGERALRMARGH